MVFVVLKNGVTLMYCMMMNEIKRRRHMRKNEELTFIHPSVRTVENTLVTWVVPVSIPDPRNVIQDLNLTDQRLFSSQHGDVKK